MSKKSPQVLVGLLLAALVGLSFSFVPANNPDAVVGTWLTGSKKGHVQIYKQGGQYFGKIIWLKEPNDPKTGAPKLDANNPDANKRKQPLQGLVNLRDFTHAGGNTWDNGKIYDPENGKEYSCKMTLRDNNTLDVRGYVGISLLGRTDTWQRVK
ncbi:DUF2147 domain-containing protein [Rhabdobacter roseus]|uniref:Uncharacterized protein (DUF2147 family) n=1 Tax=Rhabdobacter roseus TaxID=1655419 RepID=A0A840TWJ9_9BACT|nr:DUF2147 domain-containing protein [Rhabdobacter roseus]MBB5284019.1 uncharacterized protein (DUF2147 family) [Rhabdobacter roseus]